MAIMGSGRRGLQPDEIPPIFYFIMFFVVAFCAIALLLNFIHRKDSRTQTGVVDIYENMVRSRVQNRTPYIAKYLEKKRADEETSPESRDQ